MDLKALMNESPKVLTVVNAIKNDPSLLDELKTNPQEAMNKIGVELTEDELSIVQKISDVNSFKQKIEEIFNIVKGWLGVKDKKSG